MRHRTRFSDETSTGRVLKRRGPYKATIAASAEDPKGFEWWAAWQRDFLQHVGGGEIKSEVVIAITRANQDARRRLLDGIGPCPIVIVDFSENAEWLLEPFRKLMPAELPAERPALELIHTEAKLRGVAERFLRRLRQLAFRDSALAAVDHLMGSHHQASEVFRELGLAGFAPSGIQVLSPEELEELSERDFADVVARFAIALGDALSPQKQAEILAAELAGPGFGWGGCSRVAYRVIADAVQPRYIFDKARSAIVRRNVETAHQRVVEFLERAHTAGVLRPGGLKEDDSRNVRGIQVADIAAGMAAEQFERKRDSHGTRAAAAALRGAFERVFLNRRWL